MDSNVTVMYHLVSMQCSSYPVNIFFEDDFGLYGNRIIDATIPLNRCRTKEDYWAD